MSRKVIFRRAEVSVLLEVCFPRRPHEGQPRSLHVMSVKVDLTFVDQNDFHFSGLIIPAGKQAPRFLWTLMTRWLTLVN